MEAGQSCRCIVSGNGTVQQLNRLTFNYSLGYSQKGWTDGEIGALWMKQFDQQTRAKANGRARLLLVDGHNSHYTRAFLEHARQNNIHVLCYPAHGTHVYQGLDVAVFSVLKRFWSEERDRREREMGEKLLKKTSSPYMVQHISGLSRLRLCRLHLGKQAYGHMILALLRAR